MSDPKNHKIGDQVEDGYIFYMAPTGERALIAALKDYKKEVFWSPLPKLNTNALAKGLGGGFSNTFEIINVVEPYEKGNYAAKVCWDLGLNGHNWYLPSTQELELMYENLHLKNIGDFEEECYWSSTDRANIENTYFLDFKTGEIDKDYKGLLHKVRPIRVWNPNIN